MQDGFYHNKAARRRLTKAQLIAVIGVIVLAMCLIVIISFVFRWLHVVSDYNALMFTHTALCNDTGKLQQQVDIATSALIDAKRRAANLEDKCIAYELEMKRLSGAAWGQSSHLRSFSVSNRGSSGKNGLNNDIIEIGGRKLVPVGTWELTAYNPVAWQCDEDPWTTASGAKTKPGYTCAIDRAYWSFGTRFWVVGFGEVVAEDTGSKVKGRNRMDVCVSSIEMARTLGRWHTAVYMIED